MGRTIDNFFLLLWKNFLLQWRHPIQTAVEIIIPALFAILLVVLRSAAPPSAHSAKLFTPFEFSSFYSNKNEVWWYPYTKDLSAIISETSTSINKLHASNYSPNITFREFNNALEVYDHYQKHQHNLTNFLTIIEFNGLFANEVESNNYKAEIRFRFPAELGGEDNYWRTDKLYPIFQTQGPRNWWSNSGGNPNYRDRHFLLLEKELSLAFMKHLSPAEKNTLDGLNISMQRFHYPKWIEDILLEGLETALGSFIMLSLVYTCISTVKVITNEKEKQLKEAMKIMGLPNWLHWTAWFIKSFIILLISAIIMMVLLKVKWYPDSNLSVFTYSDPSVIFVFLLLYICATITFSFAISVFFSKANTAAIVAGIIWFLSYSPYTFLSLQYESISTSTKLMSSLLLNTAIGYGFQLILSFEGLEEGIQWGNVWQSITPDDNLVLGHLMMMLIFDTFLYLIIALYVEVVFPGDYGVPQPFYFFLTKSYWCNNAEEITSFDSEPNPNYEIEPTHLKPSIQLYNLSKKFSKHMAVKNLSLNIYQDQITVLLGHNGAGKTTTMSMLSGMIPPTSGTALINGYSIQKNMKKIRESFGLCPQHNILFDDLTVKEHIYFYSKLKGLTKKQEITEEIEKYIKLLQFETKANSKSSTLSGGMKRKLSVAIALCGNSKVVMCDEPTAGIDPSTRRALWDFLKTEKKGRTILLTTHFMDEADLLGDRIVIMSNGQLQCCGSSFFLKKRYGTGYKLIMDVSEKCNVGKVTSVLQNFIPNLQETSKIGSELIYTLSESYVSRFESMLESLEAQSDSLEVLSYGISLTTLEEVFMKVGDIERHNEDLTNNQSEEFNKNIRVKNDKTLDTTTTVEIGNDLLLGWSLWWNQVLAIAMKKCLSSYRSWILFLIQNAIPVLFLAVTIIMVRNTAGFNDPPNLKIDLNSYNDPVAVLTESHNNINNYATAYRNLLKDHLIDWGNQDMGKQMLIETATKRSEVRRRYIAGATYNNENITAWFNNDPYHASPLALQLVMNSILQVVKEGYSIEFHNHPLPYSIETRIQMQQMITNSNMGFQIAFNLGFSLAFASAFYTMFYIKERTSKAKHLQFVSGINLTSFWGTSYMCDFLSFIFTSALIIITLLIFQETGFKTGDELGRVISVLLTFGFSMLPLMYLASLFFDVAATGFTKVSLINIFMGVVLMMVIQILIALDLGVANHLHNIMLLYPHYSLSTGIQNLLTIHGRKALCAGLNQTNEIDPEMIIFCEQIPDYYDFQSPGIGLNILFSFIGGFIFIVILVMIENDIFSYLKYKICKKTQNSVIQFKNKEDEDVLQEKERVDGFSLDEIKNYAVVMRNISKYFKSIPAVNKLSLAISKYECFGLLGVNGAGKTTTFKLLTGDIKNFDGNAWINGLSLRSDRKKINKLIGYCPQFDALLDELTCKENLIIFGLIRGLPLSDSKLEANKLSKQFDFHQHLNKKVKELSGGNKRKLSTSIALIGNPSVIYLDEPTTGMDPATKRFLWNVLCRIRDSGKCIVLTSHSMDECEALCTRLAIMVNGEFMCLGSTQHLKSKFSNGYLLTIKLKRNENYNEIDDSKLEAVNNFVKDTFLEVEIQEKHKELITFSINDKTKTWSKMFGILERAKVDLNIEDYFIGQNSLEQIFIAFAKKQIVHYNKDNDKKHK